MSIWTESDVDLMKPRDVGACVNTCFNIPPIFLHQEDDVSCEFTFIQRYFLL